MLTVEFHGIPQLTQALQRLATLAQAALVEALQAEAERIREESRYLVPIDTGLLVSTGIVEQRTDGADISYGGKGLAEYAAIVHEDVTKNHPNGGQSHFLSQVVFEATADMSQRLATSIQASLRI